MGEREPGLGDRVVERAVHHRGNVLHERAAEGDVQHLHAAADREDVQAGPDRGARQGDLVRIPALFRRQIGGVGRLAVQGGIDVAAPVNSTPSKWAARSAGSSACRSSSIGSPPTRRTDSA
jgi:hypothetical protein